MLNKLLLLLVLCPCILWSEPVTVRTNLNGPGCNHIGIYDSKGQLLKVTTLTELSEPITDGDDSLTRQLKYAIISSQIPVQYTGVKLVLESADLAITPFSTKALTAVSGTAVDVGVSTPQ